MRIHRLKVSHLRGLQDPEPLAFPDNGCYLLTGANEAGKSTLVEAIDLLLDEKDSSAKAKVRAVRPIGQDVPTTIEAEFSAGEYRFVYRKQWFKRAATELQVISPRTEHLTGQEAHERVQQILAETTDMALWKALRFMQGSVPDQLDLTGSAALTAALDRASGTTTETGGDADTLVSAVAAEYARYFTPEKARPTGELAREQRKIEQARDIRSAAADAVREVEEDVAHHERIAREIEETTARWQAARDELDSSEQVWVEIASVEEEFVEAAARVDEAARECRHARERLQDRDALLAEVAQRRSTYEEQEQVLRELGEELAQSQERQAEGQRRKTELTQRVRDLTRTLDSIVRTHEYNRASEDVLALTNAVTRAEDADRVRLGAARELAECRVDEEALQEVEQCAVQLGLARARRDADSAHLIVTASADGQEVMAGTTSHRLDRDEEVVLTVDQELIVEIPGQLRLRWTPESAAQERADAVAAAESALQRALDRVGVHTLEAARDSCRRHGEASNTLARARERLEDLLEGKSVADLRDRLVEAEGRLAALAEHEPSNQDETDLIDADTEEPTDLAALRAELAEVEEQLNLHEVQLKAAQEEASDLRDRHARADSLLGAAHQELTAAEARLGTAREQVQDDELARAVEQAEDVRQRSSDRSRQLEQKLTELDADSNRRLRDSGREALAGVERHATSLREDLVRVEARLEQAGRQGRYDALEKAESELEQAERRLTSVTRRAEAARHLHETLQTHRQNAQRAYARPFAEALRHFGAVVFGPGLELEVDESLRVVARVVDGQRVPFECLSTGAKEQLAILTRLAVSTLVDRDQGVPVVIDDALGYSDPERLRRVVAAFGLADDVQILLLTSSPTRYAGIAVAGQARIGR
ncbi:AAA family ATPase [Austwickia chelonae]|uniref:AAA family ATPase n=1 Tax=Austwickia chelonae TaxID=100225 RepID=UPI000E240968|nr:AAA family ATPase [Austwickia chelonae]